LYMTHTPRWLAMQGRWDEAEHVMERVNPKASEREMELLHEDLQETRRGSLRELMSPGLRGALFAGLGLAMLQQFVGPNTVLVYIGCYSLSISPLFWLMTAELYPNRLRGIGASTATVANWSANLLITLTFLTAVDALGKDVVFWIYAGFAAVGLVFVRFCIPETKG